MIYIPLLFFLFLLVIIYRRNGFDLSFCMISIYAISALLSIFLYHDSGFQYGRRGVSLLPTLMYCFFAWLSVYPFYVFNTNKKRVLMVTIKEGLFKRVTIIYAAMFFIVLLLFYDQLGTRLVMANMNDLRQEYYNDDISITSGFSIYKKILAYGAIFIGGCSYFMIILFFYSLCALDRGMKFKILLFLSTLTCIVSGVLNMDRSSTFYYFLNMLLGYFLFKPYIRKENRNFLYLVGGFFMGLALFYFVAVTIARFGDSSSGTEGGLLNYAGQSYLNYCYLWDNLWYDKQYWGYIFPITNFITGFAGSFRDYEAGLYSATSVDVNIFHSSAGFFLVHLGHIASVIVPFMFFFITNKVVRANKKRTIDLRNFILIFLFAVIPQCGLITYFYTTVPRVLNFMIFTYLAFNITKKKVCVEY